MDFLPYSPQLPSEVGQRCCNGALAEAEAMGGRGIMRKVGREGALGVITSVSGGRTPSPKFL